MDNKPPYVGEAFSPEDASHVEGTAFGARRDPLTWDRDIPLLTNPFMLWDVLRLFIATAIIMYLLLVVTGVVIAGEVEFLPPLVVAIPLGIMAVLFVFVALVFYQNNLGAIFAVDDQGASIEVGQKQRRLNRWAIFLTLVFGSGRALGSALVASSQEQTLLRWRDVEKVTAYRWANVISLSDRWGRVVRLYCPPDRFTEIEVRVKACAAAGATWRDSHPNASHASLCSYGVWAGLTLVALAASLAWQPGRLSRLAFLGAGLVLVAGVTEGLIRRVVAGLASAVTLLVLLKLGQIVSRDGADITLLVVVSALGAGGLVVLSVIRLAGGSPREHRRSES